MFAVGLTGGLGSGKTTVSRLFADLGVHVIDTDLLAREVVQPGKAALQALQHHFGEGILNADGSLNRADLRAHVFKHPEERLWLEALLHPLIQEAVKAQLSEKKGPYSLVVIPLLTENYRQSYPFLDRICVVDCEEALQLQRAIARDGIHAELAQQMIGSQPTRQDRLALADDVIVNNEDLSSLESQVMTLHQVYLSLCKVIF
jgi:dephospho-CoA kinase